MKIKLKELLLVTTGLFIGIISIHSYASMLGLCNDPKETQYICCPADGGWIVSPDCDSGASEYCVNDKGIIANSKPVVTIWQDCINRGGTSVSYPFSQIKHKQ